ncbi:hypothetical protein H5410_053975 [Solanum commersonii]|uniref:Uncharacterized protein n=1 Tax=Solanum commersonii TaxID=4109 RepID=A0A9J5X7Y5_SOLCO|nr:hypothetical protein H5410_053975 [Solanum commersonii]
MSQLSHTGLVSGGSFPVIPRGVWLVPSYSNWLSRDRGFGGYLFRAEATVNLPWFINDLDKKSSATCHYEQLSTIHN